MHSPFYKFVPFWLCLFVLILFPVTYAQFGDNRPRAQHVVKQEVQISEGQNIPSEAIFRVHSTTITVIQQYGLESTTPRHEREKERLLERLEKNHGNWDVHHPRWRLLHTLYSFKRYRQQNLAEVDRWRNLHKGVQKHQRKLLESTVKYSTKLNKIDHAIESNGILCDTIVSHAMDFYGIGTAELDEYIKMTNLNHGQPDRTSVQQALKHYVRDWSQEGSIERDTAFPCLLDTLENLYPDRRIEGKERVSILLPGAGLGRLGHEIAALRGFEVTINEWSTYMSVAYHFLEARPQPSSFNFHPFVDSLSHHTTTSDLYRSIAVPDAHFNASSVLLVEGDFTTVFADSGGQYDVIVTHFFIDTARNLMSYLDTIHRLLTPGGRWINFGPLLYGTGPFVQLSLDEILDVAEAMGFEFGDLGEQCGEITIPGRRVRGKEAPYGFNEKALTKNAYMAQAWIATKIR